MDKLKVYKFDNPDVSTETVFTLAFTLLHQHDATEADAKRIARDALVDFCEAAGLDIYARDDQGNPVSISEEKILPAVEDHFRRQFVTVVSAHRQERAAREQMTNTFATLLNGQQRRRHDREVEVN